MVAYTKHALEKFKVLRRHGFAVTQKEVENTTSFPDYVAPNTGDLWLAQKDYDQRRVLRVVFRDEGFKKVAITFYPAKREGMKFKYDKQADILAIEFSNAPIDYAKEVGNFVVHFSPDGKPVYLEILNAKNFASDVQKEVAKPQFAR